MPRELSDSSKTAIAQANLPQQLQAVLLALVGKIDADIVPLAWRIAVPVPGYSTPQVMVVNGLVDRMDHGCVRVWCVSDVYWYL